MDPLTVQQLSQQPLSALAPLVQQARQGLKWTQQELADRARTSQGTIARLETARPPIKPELVEQVLQALADAGAQFHAQRQARRVLCAPVPGFRVPGQHLSNGGFLPSDKRHLPILHGGTRFELPEPEARELERQGAVRIIPADDPSLCWVA